MNPRNKNGLSEEARSILGKSARLMNMTDAELREETSRQNRIIGERFRQAREEARENDGDIEELD